jgi:hypothetical protein
MAARRTLLVLPYLALATLAGTARADERAGDQDDAETRRIERVPPVYDVPPFETKPGYGQIFATAFVGDGLRFNNPYRLRTPLGSDAESVSRTAAYADFGLGITFERPLGLQHGFALRSAFALEGVGQAVLTPSYLAWRRWGALAADGRLGVPFVLSPDLTWGFEVAGGGTWFFLGGFGVTAEIVGDFFYGAGTRDTRAASYPVLSGQLGLTAAYEVLP